MPTPSPTSPLGLIAGEGEFPKLVVAGAKRAGLRVVVVGLRDCCPDDVRTAADVYHEAGIARLGRWIRLLRREGVTQAIMAGRVKKTRMLDLPRWRQFLAYLPDWTSIKVWYFSAKDRRNDNLLRAVADEMHAKGIDLIDSTAYCQDAMAPEGVLTGAPSAAVIADIDLGWRIAKEMGRLDVGQSVAVKDKDVIAVEAIEGTDAMIERAGSLCKHGGWTLVKTAKPNQDMRFDVPTVGPGTIKRLHAAKAAALVVEAGKTLLLQKDEMLSLANTLGITIVGRKDSDAAAVTSAARTGS